MIDFRSLKVMQCNFQELFCNETVILIRIAGRKQSKNVIVAYFKAIYTARYHPTRLRDDSRNENFKQTPSGKAP